MKTSKIKRFAILFALLVSVLVTGCSRNQTGENETPNYNTNGENPLVQIEMQDGSKMVLELYPEYAPETVKNFIGLVESGFYDGLTFHRIVKDFMIQGGDPKGDGTGGSENRIPGEFAANGFTQNTLSHTTGVISMARSNHPDSASSQFFIMDGDVTSLDGDYAAFGKLIDGVETLKSISETPVSRNPWSGELSIPQEDVVIKRITMLENGEK